MKCPNCGRENPDIRLFCAYCGEILPEQDTENTDVGLYDRIPPDNSDDTAFYRRRQFARRDFNEEWPATEEETAKPETTEITKIDSPKPVRPEPKRAERPSSAIPERIESTDPDSIFKVRGMIEPEDDPLPVKNRKRRNAYEDEEDQNFGMRHVRGIVTLALLGVTALVVIIWALTPSAQLMLARIDLSWKAAPYEKLGLEAYNGGEYDSAAHYFSQALGKDPDNTGYAVYTANSYIKTGNKAKAAEYIRTCISLDPYKADYYTALMGLYNGYENMPEADRMLIDQGYRMTGDSRLDNNN